MSANIKTNKSQVASHRHRCHQDTTMKERKKEKCGKIHTEPNRACLNQKHRETIANRNGRRKISFLFDLPLMSKRLCTTSHWMKLIFGILVTRPRVLFHARHHTVFSTNTYWKFNCSHCISKNMLKSILSCNNRRKPDATESWVEKSI